MYKEINSEFLSGEQVRVILRVSDNAFIPIDSANTDYQEYLAWIAEGNEPEIVEVS